MTLLERLAQQHTNEVVVSAISVTIEKIATEAARDILSEPGFREELKELARQSIGRAFRDLRRTEPSRTTKRRKA